MAHCSQRMDSVRAEHRQGQEFTSAPSAVLPGSILCTKVGSTKVSQVLHLLANMDQKGRNIGMSHVGISCRT